MIDQNKSQAALIIRKIQQDPKYLENNFFFQNALNTFQVLNKINAIDHRLISGKLLAHITKLLISLEIKPGGPYAEDQKNPDQKLNIEIAVFLNSQNIKLSALDPYNRKINTEEKNSKILKQIILLAEKRLGSLPKFLQILTRKKINEIIKSDQDQQILLLAYFFKLSLGNCGTKISPDIIYKLGLANLLLWLSYSIYDDLIDNETTTKYLPIANWAAREFIIIINEQKISKEYQLLFKKIMSEMDCAQIWERKYARFNPEKNNTISAQIKNYQKPAALYNKSLAHALGPILILDQLKYHPSSTNSRNILLFFKYYLSVRQLQDDIYDFESDYKKGIITSANIRAIKNNIKPNQLKNYFITKELPRLNIKIIKYQKLAEMYLKSATIIKYSNYLNQFLQPLKAEPEKIQDFLETYENLNS